MEENFENVESSVSDWNQEEIRNLKVKSTYEFEQNNSQKMPDSLGQSPHFEDLSESESKYSQDSMTSIDLDEELKEIKAYKEISFTDEKETQSYIRLRAQDDLTKTEKTSETRLKKVICTRNKKYDNHEKNSNQKNLFSFWSK